MPVTHTSGRLAIALLASSLLALATLAAAQPQPTEAGFIHVEEDIRVSYERYGTDEPVLFIPNRHEMHLTFGPLLEAYDVVTWDPRGRGLGDNPNAPHHGLPAQRARVQQMAADSGQGERDPYDYCVLEKRVFFASSYVDLANMDMLLDANLCQYQNEQAHVASPVISKASSARSASGTGARRSSPSSTPCCWCSARGKGGR